MTENDRRLFEIEQELIELENEPLEMRDLLGKTSFVSLSTTMRLRQLLHDGHEGEALRLVESETDVPVDYLKDIYEEDGGVRIDLEMGDDNIRFLFFTEM